MCAEVASAIDLVVHTARLRDGRRVGVPDRGRRRPRRRGRARRDRGLRSARPLAGTGPLQHERTVPADPRPDFSSQETSNLEFSSEPCAHATTACPPRRGPISPYPRHIAPTVELPTTRLIETARKWTIHCDRRGLATLARRPHFYSSSSANADEPPLPPVFNEGAQAPFL
jgi:hypothetical protein